MVIIPEYHKDIKSIYKYILEGPSVPLFPLNQVIPQNIGLSYLVDSKNVLKKYIVKSVLVTYYVL